MLVLSRKPGESIQIGQDIYVTVVQAGRNNVRLGITAPKRLAIHRDDAKRRFDPRLQGSSVEMADGRRGRLTGFINADGSLDMIEV